MDPLPQHPGPSPVNNLTADSNLSPSQFPPKTKFHFPIIGFVVLLVIIGAVFFVLSKNGIKLPGTKPTPPSAEVVAKVGDEYLYKVDIANAKVYYPKIATDSANKNDKLIMDQLVNDSIAIQEANKEKIATLSAEWFNSPNKVFPSRITLINKIKTQVEQKQESKYEGSFVTMYFYNVPFKYKGGLDQAKSIVSAKATDLYNKVKSGQMTLQQAGDAVKNDSSLKDIDPLYQANAYTEFKAQAPNDISIFAEFNVAASGLKSGELSPLIVATDPTMPGNKKVEVAYVFGMVKNQLDKIKTFVDWINDHKKDYEVIYY